MKKYANIINEETGLCAVAIGTDTQAYIDMGMKLLDVEQSDIDNNWYLKEKCKHKTEEEKAKEREQEFKNNFFKIDNFGYFRKKPKGYDSAIESLNTAFNIVLVSGFLSENILTFYKEPDFYIEEQCSEEWLIANSFKNKQMAKEEFSLFYADFVTAWNNEEHK